jgi:hypothetical protein
MKTGSFYCIRFTGYVSKIFPYEIIQEYNCCPEATVKKFLTVRRKKQKERSIGNIEIREPNDE